jgi:hypothetical protein
MDCSSPGKHPRTLHGPKDATADETTIREWWRKCPDANIGVALDKWIVIDVDGDDGAAALQGLIPAGESLPTTWTARTGRKGGKHFFFRVPFARGLKLRNMRMGTNLDLKTGANSYMVVAPSLHANGNRYAWMDGHSPWNIEAAVAPEWLLNAASRKRAPRGSSGGDGVPCADGCESHPTVRYGRAALRAECERLRAAPEGNRNNTLNVAAFNLGQLVSDGRLGEGEACGGLTEAARDIGLDERETAKTIESGLEAGKANPRPIPNQQGDPAPTYGKLASEIEPESIDWLWTGHIARGKLHVIDGDPGLGKSALTVDLAARCTAGKEWPDGAENPQPGRAMILSAEDGPADTIRPRLEAANADLERVRILSPMLASDDQLRFPDNTATLEQAIIEMGADVVFIDPFTAYLGNIDANKDQDARKVLAGIAGVAARTNAAIVIVRHLNKRTDTGNALYRGGGSIGIIAAARVGFLVAADPQDGDLRVFACLKNNIAKSPPSLAFRLVESANGAVRVEWQGETELGPEDLLASGVNQIGRPRGRLDEACDFLQTALADGPRPSAEVTELAKKLGFSDTTMQRARRLLGVEAVKGKGEFHGAWWQQLSANARGAGVDGDVGKDRQSASARRGSSKSINDEDRSESGADRRDEARRTPLAKDGEDRFSPSATGLPAKSAKIAKP